MTQRSLELLYNGISPEEAGAFIAQKRRKAGLSGQDVADIMGVYRSYYSEIETGKRDIRSNFQRLSFLAEYLELSNEDLETGLGVSSRMIVPVQGVQFKRNKKFINVPDELMRGFQHQDILVDESTGGEIPKGAKVVLHRSKAPKENELRLSAKGEAVREGKGLLVLGYWVLASWQGE